MQFEPEMTPPGDPLSDRTWWFAFSDGRLLVVGDTRHPALPRGPAAVERHGRIVRRQYLGRLGGEPCFSAEVAPHAADPSPASWVGLRQVHGLLGEALFDLAGRAFQIMEWDRTHRFCGVCGTPTRSKTGERVKVCPRCGHLGFPRLSPAVIVAVTRGSRLLLGRSDRFPADFYSVLAGFVEPGETLEACVRREVREEVGIEVARIRYFGSQPWPFPNSLMVGFTAEWAGGEIAVDNDEIVAADWFGADALPAIPPRLSIARRLIDHFVDACHT